MFLSDANGLFLPELELELVTLQREQELLEQTSFQSPLWAPLYEKPACFSFSSSEWQQKQQPPPRQSTGDDCCIKQEPIVEKQQLVCKAEQRRLRQRKYEQTYQSRKKRQIQWMRGKANQLESELGRQLDHRVGHYQSHRSSPLHVSRRTHLLAKLVEAHHEQVLLVKESLALHRLAKTKARLAQERGFNKVANEMVWIQIRADFDHKRLGRTF